METTARRVLLKGQSIDIRVPEKEKKKGFIFPGFMSISQSSQGHDFVKGHLFAC